MRLCVNCRHHATEGQSSVCHVPVIEPVAGSVYRASSFCADARHFGEGAERIHPCGPDGVCWEQADGETE